MLAMMTHIFKNSKYEYVESYFIEDWNRKIFYTSKIITLGIYIIHWLGQLIEYIKQ